MVNGASSLICDVLAGALGHVRIASSTNTLPLAMAVELRQAPKPRDTQVT